MAVQNSDSTMHIWESPDGASWNSVTPPDYSVPDQMAPGYPQQVMVAADGRAYLLGQDASNAEVQVWVSNGETFSSSYQIPASSPILPLGIVSTGNCVIAVTLRYTTADLVGGAVASNASPTELDGWSLCGDKPAPQPAVLPLPANDFNQWSEFSVGLDGSNAAVIDNNTRYELRSGSWSRLAGTAPASYPVLSNGQSTVGVVGGRNGRSYWTTDSSTKVSTGELPPGELPDAGVAVAASVNAGCATPDGFVLGGSTTPPGGKEVAAIWWSPDGHTWNKMPVLQNSLQELNQIIGTACAPNGSVLIIGDRFGSGQSDSVSAWVGTFTR